MRFTANTLNLNGSRNLATITSATNAGVELFTADSNAWLPFSPGVSVSTKKCDRCAPRSVTYEEAVNQNASAQARESSNGCCSIQGFSQAHAVMEAPTELWPQWLKGSTDSMFRIFLFFGPSSDRTYRRHTACLRFFSNVFDFRYQAMSNKVKVAAYVRIG